ncbi:hypothetical protein K2173_020736 [Erythroxylum novogranatense]|uniref:Agmatine coumaroyltransferase-2-like n=1 Tax=Erythroxylum novogranatense TaxID=1862640 RepID=A0AAV8TLN7_9ROSI|nr:hypothetical protein K2173_020736 [Erythroxylum novogranatense]
MKVKLESTRIVKPVYEGIAPSISNHIPLSVFDRVTYDTHMPLIYVYRPPTPPNTTIEIGLQRALSEYRELAGRLGENAKGDRVIFLNDKGVRFVEASLDGKLDLLMPLNPSPVLHTLHPQLGGVEELLQVQLTRFSCGSLVVGFTAHHLVADGHSASNFLVAWGKACRGLDMSPLPLHDRTIFHPRNPPGFEFEHRGVEYKIKSPIKDIPGEVDFCLDDIVMHKAHFTVEFLSKLKAKASQSSGAHNDKPYSTFESLMAHLWRSITKARGVSASETSQIRISVNGRMRLNPRVPDEYFGNLALWAFPKARVEELLREPLPYAAKLIHDAVAIVNNNYFRSFIDFATHKADKEDLEPNVENNYCVLNPNLAVDSWLRFPFHELDFGGGSPYMFLPSFFPSEGVLLLLPSFPRDGSIDAFVALFHDTLASFNQICYSLD